MRTLNLFAAILMSLAWLVPNRYPPWTSFYNDSSAALSLLLLFVALLSQRAGFRINAVACVCAAVACIPWLQYSLGLVPFSGDASISSLYLLGLATAVVVGDAGCGLEPPTLPRLLSISAVAGGLISSFIAIYQWCELGSLGIWAGDAVHMMRARANLGQPNNLATLLGLAVSGLVLLREQRRLSGLGISVMLLPLLLAAAMTESRTSLIFGPLILGGIYIGKRQGIPFQTAIKEIGIVTVAYTALWWVEPWLQQALFLQPHGHEVVHDLHSPRFRMWALLFDAMSVSPWYGFGWLQVGAAEFAVADRQPVVGELWLQGHNLFVDLIVWCGYPVGLLLGGLVLLWFFGRMRRVESVEALIGMLVLAVIGAHSMLELPYHYAYFLLPAGLWVGVIEHDIGSRGKLGAHWAHMLVALCAGLTLATWSDYGTVEEDFRLVRFESLRIGPPHVGPAAPSAPFLSSLTAYLRVMRTPPARGMSNADLNRMYVVARRYPYPGLIARLVFAYTLNGRQDEARQFVAKLQHIYGVAAYDIFRRDLHELAADGSTEFRALEASLPG